jgi:hypothetical protein
VKWPDSQDLLLGGAAGYLVGHVVAHFCGLRPGLIVCMIVMLAVALWRAIAKVRP